ncbi:MAG TPA: hypothetical protein VE991_01775 [Acidimicrobiales bacterium]|nr:hypothetical protein [Acidimicrobiales bacterium]
MPEEWMTRREAAEHLGLSGRSITWLLLWDDLDEELRKGPTGPVWVVSRTSVENYGNWRARTRGSTRHRQLAVRIVLLPFKLAFDAFGWLLSLIGPW